MTCLAEQLMNEADPAALGRLFAALAATVADPRTEAGSLALEDDFVSGLSALADELGVLVDTGRVPEQSLETATGSAAAASGRAAARADAAEAEYVRLFVSDRYGPQCPPWASYYTEGRLAGSSAIRARGDEASIGGAAPLEEADTAVRELGSLAILLLEGRREIAARYFAEHLSPWIASFADRLSDHAHLEHLQLTALLLRELFAPASHDRADAGVTA
jgi:TorA maturation chaperone TorD